MKEEIEERTERIRQSMDGKETGEYSGRQIQFKRSNKKRASASMMQLVIAVVLGMLILGWLEFGNEIFYYALWVIVPGYLLFRLKSIRGKR